MSAVHEFGDSLRRGEAAERFLDALFGRHHVITPVSRAQQRAGIDRIFAPKAAPEKLLRVEYKTDWRAHDTGRVFIETVSVDTAGKAGWALKSTADWLVYYLPQDDLVYLMTFATLRRLLPAWSARYEPRPANNRDYQTWGLCVDQCEFEEHAQVINLADVPDLPAREGAAA